MAAVAHWEQAGIIREVVQMMVESLIEHGEAVPEEPADQVQVFAEPQVAVIV